MGRNFLHSKCVFILRPLLLSVLLMFFVISLVNPPVTAAEKVNKIYEIQQKIRKAWKSVSESKEEEDVIRANMEDINDTIRKKEKELRSFGRQTSLIQSEIASLENEIEGLSANLDSRKQYLKEYVNFLYREQYGDNAFALTSATNYQDLARKSKYISLLANYEGRVIEKYMSDVQEVNSKRKNLQELVEELETNKAAALDKKKELQSDLSDKNELLSGIKEKQMAYEKKIKELEASSRKIQGVVKNSERKKIPESILGDGFVSLKGNLPWPIYGKVLIPYGDYKDPVFNVSTFKNGIEIEAGPDDLAKAVAGGRVIYAGDFEGYGMLLIIDHGDGYNSLYGNLSGVLLKKGELLIKGMELGKITGSKLLNTPALYFEIRYNGKPVDPMEWLEKRG
jgi:septal ring factor EnvC (AmiA/AmiB activator)